MILSRILARRRIAAGNRPGFVAAWLPVLADALLVAIYALGVYALLKGWVWSTQPPGWAVYLGAFILIFVPTQAVLILSALWATKSRWQDSPEESQ